MSELSTLIKYYNINNLNKINRKNIIDILKNKSDNYIQNYISNSVYNYYNLGLNIHGDMNIGCMLRSSHQCGCKKFIIYGKKKYDKRSSVGAQYYISCQFLTDDVKLILEKDDYILDENILYNYIIENKCLPIFVELDNQSIKVTKDNIKFIILESIRLDLVPLFIYGNETYGISNNILNIRNKLIYHYTLELKQKGILPSYNVSNALSIISYYVMEIFDELNISINL